VASLENANNILNELLARFSPNTSGDANNTCPGKCGDPGSKSGGINPSQAIIIGAILAGVLQVDSVLVDRDQNVEIVLVGSLKKKTQLEKLLDQVGSMPFDEVVKAWLGRL
jgi:hypothetical protein